MITETIAKTILALLAADQSTTAEDFANIRDCLNGKRAPDNGSRFVAEDGMLLSLSDSARFLGVSRDKFREIANEIVNGAPRFARMTVPGERYPRFYKVQLLAYATPPSDSPRTAEPLLEAAC